MNGAGRFDAQGWDTWAGAQAKRAIALWLVGGLAYQAYTGRLVSWPTLLLFFPGIFIVSAIALPAALLNRLKVQHLTQMRAGQRQRRPVAVLAWSVWYLIDLAYPIGLGIAAMRIAH